MPQIFHRSTNTYSKVSIFGAVFFLGFLLWLFGAWSRSSWATQAGVADMTWTPKAGPTDLATNELASTAAWTETDADRDF